MKKIKHSIIYLFLFSMLITYRTSNIEASNISFQLTQSSQAVYISGGVKHNIQASTAVPYGSTIEVDYNLTNRNVAISSLVVITLPEGLGFLPYYEGVLRLNGNKVSNAQYQAFITSGWRMSLSPQTTKISIQVKSIGSDKNRISTNLNYYSSEATNGVNSLVSDHSFAGQFSLPKYYTLAFYEDKDLVQSHTVLEGSFFDPMIRQKEGYQFIGYNTKADGTGTNFDRNAIYASQVYYAIYQMLYFDVSYIIDDQIYKVDHVPYGGSAELFKFEDDKRRFVRWDGDYTNIKTNIFLTAVFEELDKKETNTNMIYALISKEENSKMIERIKQDIFESKEQNKSNFSNNHKILNYSNQDGRTYIYVGIGLCLCGIVYIGLRKKRIRFNSLKIKK